MDSNPPKPVVLRFDEIEIGREAYFNRTITEKDLKQFAEITGDYNPLHFDEEYARNTRFKKRIAPGLLTSSFYSRLIGMVLPGRQALYLSQEFKFVKPVFIGDTLTIKGLVSEKIPGKNNCIILDTEITNQDNIIVLTGKARVMIRD
ncbi:MaoC family dehydratase [candidate division KSB1 bacterium]|nr:MaoC family dehydratase [candidate division KSB1 bacterium]